MTCLALFAPAASRAANQPVIARTNATVITHTNLGFLVQTVSGAGNGNTNYTLSALKRKVWLGSSNVNIAAVMDYTNTTSFRCTAVVTNLSAINWGIGFSSTTNRWRFLGPNNVTNSPTVLTNNTALVLDMDVEGTNVLCDWRHYSPGL